MGSKIRGDTEHLARFIAEFKDLSKQDKLKTVEKLSQIIKEHHNLVDEEILGSKEIKIPIGIFHNSLGSLEAIVKYLRENLNLSFIKISKLLNRSNKTIWATYSKAKSKHKPPFTNISKEIMIPLSQFSNRSYSTLESLVSYVKSQDHTNHEVAKLLNLDDRTIWTINDRIKKKIGR